MLMTDIIAKKRNNAELTHKEIYFFVDAVTNGLIPDYQISALLMAIAINGMSTRETLDLTLAMQHSGDTLDLSRFGDKSVDKHSTGGVGDKTTPIVAAVCAALGCKVAKMSGRGLGYTGGTIDKLEAITGFKTNLSEDEFFSVCEKTGMCIMGKSSHFAPADKRIYEIRDVTATVQSIPLIASSVMSKKLAMGAKNIVLDVKYGSGAFMKNRKDAVKLAQLMVEIGKGAGRNTVALVTNMNAPLGCAVGNSLEIKEICDVLKGKGAKDLTLLCIELCAYMYSLCFSVPKSEALPKIKQAISDGSAFKLFCETVALQGGDVSLVTGEKDFPCAEYSLEILSLTNGFVNSIDCGAVGKASCLCGAGRETIDNTIDYSAGIILNKKVGDAVKKNDVLATLYGAKQKVLSQAEALKCAYKITTTPPRKNKLIYKVIK